jgi:hypothetical protein
MDAIAVALFTATLRVVMLSAAWLLAHPIGEFTRIVERL